jgi:hypothetical protein
MVHLARGNTRFIRKYDPYSVAIKSPLMTTLQNIYVKLTYLQKTFLF